MEEKRKFQRFMVNVEVHWKKVTHAEERTALHISHVKDASLGGICLVLHPNIQVGDILQLDIKLPGNKNVVTRGEVMWVNSQARVKGRTSPVFEGGIRFLDLKEADRELIGHFIFHSIDVQGHK